MNIVVFRSSHVDPYPLQIVGESNYREEIEEVTGYDGEEDGIDESGFTARLILDDGNIYDRGNAVAVEINFKTVGYLSKPDAKRYRAKLKELGLSDVVGECSASIKGGFIDRSGEQADFGVRLDIIIDELKLLSPVASKTIQPASASTPLKPVRKKATAKIPFIPMNGKGCLYYLFALPIIASVNIIILIVAGCWLGLKWALDRLSGFNKTS